eukprot:TRINITY_DN17626_c0_g1_i1.p1 TRINITY_DN17626_c0_g1~~TRINITY_DN17626_c0_g1_i1.p1  ORF type:complete len:1165 (+),score=163.57 TRINITY_DN17626_c0_g1_i1:591-4085(+)
MLVDWTKRGDDSEIKHAMDLDVIKREDILKKKGDCIREVDQKLAELRTKWIADFRKGVGEKIETLARRLITMQMLDEKVNAIAVDLPSIFKEFDDPEWKAIEAQVDYAFLEFDKDATLKRLAGTLRTTNDKYFAGYNTKQRNEKTNKVTLEVVIKKLLEKVPSKNEDPKQNDEITNTPFASELLETLYKQFKLEWEEFYVKDIDLAIDKAKYYGAMLRAQSVGKKSQDEGKRFLFSLCVQLFVLWSRVKTKSHGGNYKTLSDSTVTPHVTQVLGVFRLLGFCNESDEGKSLDNYLNESFDVYDVNHHFLEILTGEGKSIVVAITAAILAMMGNEVHCMCYSAYLSERDRKEFNEIFEVLSVPGIHWGTYEEHCERALSGEVSMRDRIKRAISSPKPGDQHKEAKDPASAGGRKIVIIDETDTLWSFKTYQKEYVALATVQLDSLSKLTDFMWKNREEPRPKLLTKVEESEEFKECVEECIRKFVNTGDDNTRFWNEVMMGCTRNMVRDLHSHETVSYNYDPVSGKLFYDENHGVSVAIRHSYKTMWHAYDFVEKHADQKQGEKLFQKDDYIVLNIIGAKIAYANICKEYDLVLALTGTLSSMHKDERGHIEKELKDLCKSERGEKKPYFTYMPSSFEKQTLQEIEVRVTSNSEYHKEIAECAKKHIKSQNQDFGPVCILFETDKDVSLFHESDAYKSLIQTSGFHENILKTSSRSIGGEISKITKISTLTLMTEPFARGIDPRVADSRVKDLGVLLIQTYVSHTEADLAQAKGRVGRQDEKGLYALIINIDTLDPRSGEFKEGYFKFSPSDIDDLNQTKTKNDDNRKEEINTIIRNLRRDHHKAAFAQAMAEVKNTLDRDNDGKKFIENLVSVTQRQVNPKADDDMEKKAKTLKKVLDFIKTMNDCVIDNKQITSETPDGVFDLVFCIDATGSMKDQIKPVKKAILDIARLTEPILKRQGIDKVYEINIVAYRNYGGGMENLITYTGFKPFGADQKNEDHFTNFLEKLDTVDCVKTAKSNKKRNGGEAVEAALSYANHVGCSAIVVVGDAPPMTSDSVKSLRELKGESYWQSKDVWIRKPTDYIKQANILKSKGIKIHTISLKSDHVSPEIFFEKMSAITGGKAFSFDNSKKVAAAIVESFIQDVKAGNFKVKGEAENKTAYCE